LIFSKINIQRILFENKESKSLVLDNEYFNMFSLEDFEKEFYIVWYASIKNNTFELKTSDKKLCKILNKFEDITINALVNKNVSKTEIYGILEYLKSEIDNDYYIIDNKK